MGDLFLTGTQGQATDQPAAPTLMQIPAPDGTQAGTEAALTALTNNVNALSGVGPRNSNADIQPFLSPGKGPSKTQQNSKDNKKKNQNSARFIEVSRQTKETTITDPNSGASVTFTDITQLIMQDTVTKEQWVWNR
jgi:hypothetical protein